MIVGAGGHGVVVADAAEASQAWSRILFVDDEYPTLSRSSGWDVVGDCSSLEDFREIADAVVVAVGDNRIRSDLLHIVEQSGLALTNIIHPRASVSERSEIGDGSVVMANAVVNARAKIGMGCIVNTAATVDHDCLIGNSVHVAPGANLAAEASVGDRSWIGIGAAVREQISIGSDVVIGAGAAVVDDVANGMTMVGVPARPIQFNSPVD